MKFQFRLYSFEQQNYFDSNTTEKRKIMFLQRFPMDLFFCGRKCFHATSQKRALSHVISFAVNYRSTAHSEVSYRFNGESDNVVLK